MESVVMSSTEVRIQTTSEGCVDMPNGSFSSVLCEKIEFHPARKQFNGSRNSDDFRIETLNPDSGRERTSGLEFVQSKKRRDGAEFVDGLDPELSLEITFRRIGAGLENLGNTCFLNSVLQCLTYTEPLAAYLQSGKHQNSCHIAGFCVLCAIQRHVSCALQSTGRSLVPKDLVSNLRCISRNFRNARQEDAHEYMVNLLESMHKCCLPSGVPSESPAAYEKSLVHKIFGGRLCSQVECQQCFSCSNKFDPFLDLSLEIVGADSLSVALRNFTASELLDGGGKQYQCQQCKQKVRAKKRLTVHKAPYVLTIHLKRFYAHDPGSKVDKKVSFDRSLDMKPFVSGCYEGDLKYSLYGVLVHFGHNTHSGHYVCYVRTSSGMWYLLNDNQVCQVSEKNVLEQKAYMLFYVRDRKKIAPSKPVAVVQKENARAMIGSNVANLFSKQFSKEHAAYGSTGNILPVTNSSAGTNKKSTLKVGISKEIIQKEAKLLKNDALIMAECLAPKASPVLEPLSALVLNGSSKGVPFPNPEMRERLPPSSSSVMSTTDTSKLENSTVTTGAITGDSNGASTCCNCPQSCAINKIPRNETSQKIDLVLNAGFSSIILSGDCSGKTVMKVHRPVSYLDKSSESCQDGSLPSESDTGNLLSDPAVNGGQGAVHELVSNPSVMPNECFSGKAPGCTPQKKVKKRFPKFRIPSMHLGSNFFRVSSIIRKKKKHKKSKHCTLVTQNLFKEHLTESNCFSSELGPSTSKKSIEISSNLTKSQRKKAKSGSRKGAHLSKYIAGSVMDIIDGEFRDRNNESAAVLATYGESRKSSISISEANQQNVKDGDFAENSSKSNASNNEMMSTRGVEETTVARWDDIELPRPEILESNGTEIVSIGYVPNEWDEEYDRGKRKKLRHAKHDFGGPNPFQEMASKKSQSKKVTMDRSSSGNRPFRI